MNAVVRIVPLRIAAAAVVVALAAVAVSACATPPAPRGLAKASRTRLNHCVADAHDRDPTMAGKVAVDVAIGEEGLIRLATHQLDGNLDADFLRCVGQVYLDADVEPCSTETDPVADAPNRCLARRVTHEAMDASLPTRAAVERAPVPDFVVLRARGRPRAVRSGEACLRPDGGQCALCTVVDADQRWLATDPVVDRAITERCADDPDACVDLPAEAPPLFAPCDGGLCCLAAVPAAPTRTPPAGGVLAIDPETTTLAP